VFARYSLVYLALWGLEWGLGLSIETILTLSITLLATIEVAGAFLRKGHSPLWFVFPKNRGASKKKQSKLQKICSGVVLSTHVGMRRFLSNPFFRLSKAQACVLAGLIWYVASMLSLFEGLIHMLLASERGLPKNYNQEREAILTFFERALFDNAFVTNQSYVIGWVLGLMVFLGMVASFWGKVRFDLGPILVGSLSTLLGTLAAIFALEALKPLVINVSLSFLCGLLGPKVLVAIYIIFQVG
jgi:hypothetical protein